MQTSPLQTGEGVSHLVPFPCACSARCLEGDFWKLSSLCRPVREPRGAVAAQPSPALESSHCCQIFTGHSVPPTCLQDLVGIILPCNGDPEAPWIPAQSADLALVLQPGDIHL